MANLQTPTLRRVAYERVSTARQGRSGLGLAKQRKAINDFAAARGAVVLARFTEVDSGKEDARPELTKALSAALFSSDDLDSKGGNAPRAHGPASTTSRRSIELKYYCHSSPFKVWSLQGLENYAAGLADASTSAINLRTMSR